MLPEAANRLPQATEQPVAKAFLSYFLCFTKSMEKPRSGKEFNFVRAKL